MNKIKIKYHVPDMTKLVNVGGAISDWIDLRTAEDVFIPLGEYFLISLGVSMQIPENHEAIMAARSSGCKNFGIMQTNGIAVIDEKYCGDNDIWHFPAYCAIPKNTKIVYVDENGEEKEKLFTYGSDEAQKFLAKLMANKINGDGAVAKDIINGTFIPKNSRICQFRLFKHQERVIFEEVETLGNPDRGGIGSTGTE